MRVALKPHFKHSPRRSPISTCLFSLRFHPYTYVQSFEFPRHLEYHRTLPTKERIICSLENRNSGCGKLHVLYLLCQTARSLGKLILASCQQNMLLQCTLRKALCKLNKAKQSVQSTWSTVSLKPPGTCGITLVPQTSTFLLHINKMRAAHAQYCFGNRSTG